MSSHFYLYCLHNKGFKKEFTSYRNTKEELNMGKAEQRLPRCTTSKKKKKLHGLRYVAHPKKTC